MIRTIMVAIGCIALNHAMSQDMSYSQPGKDLYLELPDPSVSGAGWSAMPQPVQVSFASSDIRYPEHQLPANGLTARWSTTAWKGEKVHTQLLIWTKVPVRAASYELSPLTGSGGSIAANHISAGFLRYVMTDEFRNGCGVRKPTDFDSSLVEDAIDIVHRIPVQANSVQPVWLSIEIPRNASAGEYRGTVTVMADKKYTLSYKVRVVDRVLPPPAEWTFDLDLWQHPAAIARIHHVQLWSDAHFRIMRPYYTMLANAGQKNITASIMNEPWGHQTYDDFPGLVKWTKRKHGSWSYDYTLFDKYVSFVMDCGIRRRINCYTMVPWALSFRYFDEASGKDTLLQATIGSPEYTAHWTPMLKDFTLHLKSKGWFGITSIAMDERAMKDMQVVIALLKSIDPAWKIALAGNYHSEIESDIFDYCLASNQSFDPQTLQRRKDQGKPSTYYTCCVEKYPNGFTFSPPAENVWIGWYAAAKGFTGYLRWAYNSWVADPLRDSRFRRWPAGDTYQVYPGPRTSIRMEKMIEGVQDFEKIRLTRERLQAAGDKQALEKLEKTLQDFTIPKLATTPAADMVTQAKELLNN